jgi:hypothetical protein
MTTPSTNARTRKPVSDKLDLAALETRVFARGNHPDRSNGLCVMELAAWMAGEPHSDAPECVSPTIRKFLVQWNDDISDDAERTRLLRPLLPLVLDSTASDGVELKRSYLAFDWLVRVHGAAFADLVPSLRRHGDALRELRPICDERSARRAAPTVRAYLTDANAARAAARNAARAAARDAAGDAAWDAAGDAAGAAARDAAWDAARAAAWDAAGDAARAAAWDAAGDAARAAARDAAGDAARDAAGDAAWAAAGDAARAAAWAAARAALAPAVAYLQDSAAALVRRMVAVTDDAEKA